MFALIYVSMAREEFDEEDIFELEKHSCHKNQILDITGYLNFKKGKFLQYLEGEEERVRQLMDTISADTRHHIVRIMPLPDVENRRFANCYMRYWTYNELVQINMNDMLENVLLGMNEKIYGEKALEEFTLKLVTRMAEVHKLYPQAPRSSVRNSG